MQKPTPPNWGKDNLTSFIDDTINNSYATHVNDKEFYPTILKLDQTFATILANMDHTKQWIESIFFYRAHSIYRSSIRMIMSGQIPESFILLRGVLEHSLYAFYIFNDPDPKALDSEGNQVSRFHIWVNRDQSDDAKKLCKNTFQIGPIKRELEALDNKLGQVCNDLYDRTIDYGSHPNQAALLSNITLKKHDDGSRTIFNQYLNCGGLPWKHALKSVCQSGLCSLLIFQILYKERFDILGVSAELESFKRYL